MQSETWVGQERQWITEERALKEEKEIIIKAKGSGVEEHPVFQEMLKIYWIILHVHVVA